MCQQAAVTTASSHPCICKCVKNDQPDMFDPLIPKTPTTNSDPIISHLPITTRPDPIKNATTTLTLREARSIAQIAIPMVMTGLLLYSRSIISMIFLGRLGDLALAGGSLAIGFANITGYSILSGLAVGMEPICGQAFGAKKLSLLGISLQRTVLLLLLISFPIAILWINVKEILVFFGQNEQIATEAQSYLVYSILDLLAQSFLHPLRIYLRTQSITFPLTVCASFATVLHIPINYILVFKLGLGSKGVALSGVVFNFNMVGSLVLYVVISGVYKTTWGGFTTDCFRDWGSLLNLAIPSCVSVCLEWWWYEIMIILCGLLSNPEATVASMGILIQTTSLIYIFPSSLSFSVSTRIGNELGAGEPGKAKLAAKVGIFVSFMLGFMALCFAYSVRNIWARMFTNDVEIITLTSLVLPIIGLCELGNCPQTTGCGVLRGTARPKVGANINLGCFYFVGMPVAVVLGFFVGLDFMGMWLGLLAAQMSCVVTMMIVISKTDWVAQARRARELTGAAAVSGFDENEKEAIIKEDDDDLNNNNNNNNPSLLLLEAGDLLV